MKRAAFALLWTFVFLMLCCVVAGVVSAITLEGDVAQNQAAIDEASRKWVLPMFFGSMLAAVGLSAMGLLPGTRRRPAVTTDSGEPEYCDYPAALPTMVMPFGTPEERPPELAALGPPLAVYAPGWLASMSGFARLATFVLGVLLFVAPMAIIDAVGRDQLPKSAPSMLLLGGILA